MHLGAVPGKYVSDWQPAPMHCRCGAPVVEVRQWESDDGAYEDSEFRCRECGAKWWVESSDA